MRSAWIVAGALLGLSALAADGRAQEPAPPLQRQMTAGSGVAIAHQGVGCIVAGQFPRFEARFDPSDTVGRGRVRFRPGGGPQWYSVVMTREGDLFVGVIPKPTRKLKSIDYYIEVTGTAFATARTEEYSPDVVSGMGACQGDKIVAGTLSAAAVVLEGPLGAAAIPAGFSATGVTVAAAGGAAGATSGATAGGTAGAGGGGGLSTTALVAGGVAAAAVTGVAVAAGGGGEDAPAAPACQPGPLTAALVAPTTSLQCGQPFRTGVSVTNQTCAAVTVQSIQLLHNAPGGPICTPFTGQFTYQPAVTTVPAGQTLTVFNLVSDPFCCVGGPCAASGQCPFEETFTVQTSVGALVAGVAQLQVSYAPGCLICP